MEGEFITVGKVGRTRELRGEVYIIPLTDFPERFVSLKEILIRTKNRWEAIGIESIRFVAEKLVVKFAGFDTPEAAARLTNRELAVRREEIFKLPDGVHYVFELIDCEVMDEKTGRRLGILIEVEHYPANDVYLIETTDGRKIACPAVASIVKKIDVANKVIVVESAGLAMSDSGDPADEI